MRRNTPWFFSALLPLAAACAQGSPASDVDLGRGGSSPVGTGGAAGTGGVTSASTTGPGTTGTTTSGGTTTTGGGVPSSCSQVNGSTGCCVGDTAYWCQSGSLRQKSCTGSTACGWSSKYSDYECVTAPGGPDPSHQNPIACE